MPLDEDDTADTITEEAARLHGEHQMFLRQQDILGTFYDTLSMFRSLPRFPRLKKIHIIDFDWAEGASNGPDSREHGFAFARAFWNIAKSLAYNNPHAFAYLETWEIDRLDYQVFLFLYKDGQRQTRQEEDQAQLTDALSRIRVLRIKNFMNSDTTYTHAYSAQFLTELLFVAGGNFTELSITDSTTTGKLHADVFPFGWSVIDENFRLPKPNYRELTRTEPIFENLTKLELKGKKTIQTAVFVGMLMSLPSGVLRELVLDSLGIIDGTMWINFFRCIAFKADWVATTPVWQGAHLHYVIQYGILNENQGHLDSVPWHISEILEHESDEEHMTWLKDNVWKGLKLEKCVLTGLVDVSRSHVGQGSLLTRRGPNGTVFSMGLVHHIFQPELDKFQRWMVQGLDATEYCSIGVRT